MGKVAQVHSVSDGMLLAASRLTKSARRWFDVEDNGAVESWQGLRSKIFKIFDCKILFYKKMENIEARSSQ